jgi:hypothetical protein
VCLWVKIGDLCVCGLKLGTCVFVGLNWGPVCLWVKIGDLCVCGLKLGTCVFVG